MSDVIYQHTQRSSIIFPMMLVLTALFTVIAYQITGPTELRLIFFGIAALIAVISVVMSRLTVTVDQTHLSWVFAFSFWRKSVPLKDIATVEVIKTNWLDGWGIRLTHRGWLYNVEGFDAVKVELVSGKRVLVGTDQPDALVAALKTTP